jgi:guanylate kinase
LLVVISGPSGVGKSTVIEALRARIPDPDYRYIVTCTTREARSGEVAGQSYHFMRREEFRAAAAAGQFLEWAEVHGNLYATPRAPVMRALAAGQVVILNINVQGASAVRAIIPGSLLIFLAPPSLEALLAHLYARATESAAELALRQHNAGLELARASEYDYIVRNEEGEVKRTAAQIETIIRAERAKRAAR